MSVFKVIQAVQEFSNQELRELFIEVSDGTNHNLSPNADKLFKIYNDDHWFIGAGRYSEVLKCIEVEIINRFKTNKL